MGEISNLAHRDAIEKIRQLADGEIVMFSTFAGDGVPTLRPMATQGIDADGTIWFFSQRSSRKNGDIAINPKVQLVYASSSKSEYLSITGHAAISRDQAKIDELWSAFAKTWFTRGPGDPELTLISVKPTDGHYWDTKHNKMVQLAKIAVGALTGKTMDDGVEGKLDV